MTTAKKNRQAKNAKLISCIYDSSVTIKAMMAGNPCTIDMEHLAVSPAVKGCYHHTGQKENSDLVSEGCVGCSKLHTKPAAKKSVM